MQFLLYWNSHHVLCTPDVLGSLVEMMEAAYEALIASYHNPLVPSDEKMLVSDTLQSMDNNYPFSKKQ